jgi:hypothetical protein
MTSCSVIFNTLDGMSGFGPNVPRSKPGQALVLLAMESGKYYPSMYKAKEYGFNATCGGWLGLTAARSLGWTESGHSRTCGCWGGRVCEFACVCVWACLRACARTCLFWVVQSGDVVGRVPAA